MTFVGAAALDERAATPVPAGGATRVGAVTGWVVGAVDSRGPVSTEQAEASATIKTAGTHISDFSFVSRVQLLIWTASLLIAPSRGESFIATGADFRIAGSSYLLRRRG